MPRKLDRPGWWAAVAVRCGENDGRCGSAVAYVYVLPASDALAKLGDLFVGFDDPKRLADQSVMGLEATMHDRTHSMSVAEVLDAHGLHPLAHLGGDFIEPATPPSARFRARCKQHGVLAFDVAAVRDAVARAQAAKRSVSLVARVLDA